MTYLQDKKNRQNTLQKRVVIILLVLVFVTGAPSIKSFIAPAVHYVFNKSSSIASGVTENRLFAHLNSKESLYKENLKLKESMAILQEENNLLEIIDVQNTEFRNILEASPENQKKILVKPTLSSGFYDSLIIDAGINKGIQNSQILIGVSGAMLGTVSEAYESSSQVQLIDSSKITTNLVSLDSSIYLEAKGDSRGVLRAQIPRDSIVEIGEVVVLKENPLLSVGTIAEVRGDERNPFKEVLIRLKDQSRYSQYMYILQ